MLGGTTTVTAFAAQHRRHEDMPQVVAEYAALAKSGALIDYAFHIRSLLIRRQEPVHEHMPALVDAGARFDQDVHDLRPAQDR
ncbi:MAG: hypothetical protein QM757_09425 [Paludibaculum sp.]